MTAVAYMTPHPRYGATMGKVKHIVVPTWPNGVLTTEAALCGKRGKLGWVRCKTTDRPTCPKCLKIEADLVAQQHS